MSTAIDETIKEIAVKHGISLNRDDPVLILHTMNAKLLEENKKQQQELLAQFKEEIELAASSWQNDAKDKAETILNQSLAGSKKLITKMSLEATNENLNAIKNVIVNSINECKMLNQQARKTSRFSLIICSCLLATSFLFSSITYILR